MSSPDPERQLLHYRIINKVGEGGMGQVFRAEDTRLGRHVAIKLLSPDSTQDTIARRRLLAEAQSASVLNHPNVVTIYTIEEQEDLSFIVMEFVEGDTLTSHLTLHGALPLTNLLDIGIQVADALEAAHAIGLIHRDIKPSNILITPKGVAKVADFGLAKMLRVNTEEVDREAQTLAANLTGPGMVLGTTGYMSPEQTRGEQLDNRTDIFSLGSVLYEAATRTRAFNGPSILTVMHSIATIDPAPPSKLRPELPREFDVILERALAKDKLMRYSTAGELATALRSLRASLSGTWSGFPIVFDPDLIDRSLPSFVGREPEMRRLEGFLKQAVEGTGRVVFITGEPGIGKTSLCDEFLRRVRKQQAGLLIARGRCVEQYGTGEAYLPFLDAMGELLQGPGRERIAAILRTYAPTWCMELPTAFASSGSLEKLQQETIGATKERMMREMGDALGMLSTTSPVVLLFEDLHWADPSSVDLLRHLCQRIGAQRMMIAGTFRPEDLERTGHPLKSYKVEMQAHNLCEEIALKSLSLEHVAAYLDATYVPNDFPSELASLVHDKTEGHPLFATNLIQYLGERGDFSRSSGVWSLARPLSEMHLEAPESVRAMISKKIDALSTEERRALQYASVEGTEFLSTVSAKLLGVDEIDLEESLSRIEKTHRLIETLGEEELPDGSLTTRYRFAHALYQNFLYGDLVPKRRVALHQQAGEQLVLHYGQRAPLLATQLALHFERGRDFARAVEYLIHAGDHAAKLYGYAEAAKHYSKALGLVDKLPAHSQVETLATLYQKRGTVNHALSNFTQAALDLSNMLDQARAMGSLELQSAALNALTMTLFFSHRLDECVARAKEALEVAEQAGNEMLRVETTLLIGLKHLCYGELKEAKVALDDVVTNSRRLNHKAALMGGVTWRSCLHFFQSEYEDAVEKATEGRRLASELRDGFLMLTALFFIGLSQGNQGKMSASLKTLHEAIDIAKRNGDLFWYPRLPNCIGWIYRELHDFESARRHNDDGIEVARRHHVLEAEANSLINRSIDCIRDGDHACTNAAFKDVHDIFARDAWFRWRYEIRLYAATAEHWLLQGDLDKAREFVNRLMETATEHEVHKYKAVAHRLMGEISIASGDPNAADEHFNAALAELKDYPAPLVAWKTYAGAARAKTATGDVYGGMEAASNASEIVKMIAANVADEKLRETFVAAAEERLSTVTAT